MKVITEIHSITSSSDWYVDKDYSMDINQSLPVCFFALVSTYCKKYDLSAKEVIPVTADLISEFYVGKEIDNIATEIMHKREFLV
ncbi:hypothetical protein FXI35_004888 [Escherichia coli]|nr:hypothetical protein [Escherichia coli]